MDIRRGVQEACWLASDAYVALVSNVGMVAGNMLNGLLAGEVAYINFRAGETGTGLWLSAAAIAMEGLAFHGAYMHDKAEAEEAVRAEAAKLHQNELGLVA